MPAKISERAYKDTRGKHLMLDPTLIVKGWRIRNDLGNIDTLIESIRALGQLQAVLVKKVSESREPDRFEIVAGYRRVLACRALKRHVEARAISPEDEYETIRIQIDENRARKDFDPFELALGLKRQNELYKDHVKRRKEQAEAAGQPPPPRTKRFTKAAADDLGIGEAKVKELLQVASLPAERVQHIEAAKTPKERNLAIRRTIKEVRTENRERRLEALASERGAPLPTAAATCVIKLLDNREYFAQSDDESIDIILTDPPYGMRKSLISYMFRKDRDTNFGTWDSHLDTGWLAKAAPLLADGGQALIFCPTEAVGEYKYVGEMAGLTYRGSITWWKTNPGTVNRPCYLSAKEELVWFTNGDRYAFAPWANGGAEEVHNVIRGPICGGNERLDHPTQKPEWILERLLRRHAPNGARVLDPFAGVGSTLAVCKRLGYPVIGIECEPQYVSIATRRLRLIKYHVEHIHDTNTAEDRRKPEAAPSP